MRGIFSILAFPSQKYIGAYLQKNLPKHIRKHTTRDEYKLVTEESKTNINICKTELKKYHENEKLYNSALIQCFDMAKFIISLLEYSPQFERLPLTSCLHKSRSFWNPSKLLRVFTRTSSPTTRQSPQRSPEQKKSSPQHQNIQPWC